jgi:hypothetical protein
MRTTSKLSAALCALALSIASPAFSNSVEVTPTTPTETVEARNEKLVKRLEEIKAMNPENMSRSEKRALRKEVKKIEKELAASGGIYISAGALILIIVLLIIFL